MTDAEKVLWRALRETFPDLHWRHQVPFGSYVADFCSHRARLIVEADGGQHGEARQAEPDAERTRFLNGEGYRVLRFWNHDILGNTDGVLTQIADALQKASPLGGEVGGGPAASAAEETIPTIVKQPGLSAADAAGPPPNPPHKGEGSGGSSGEGS